MRYGAWLWLAFAAASACGGDEPKNGDCAWLEGNNCWKTVLQAVNACVPPPSETGNISTDGTTCTYGSGFSVSIAPPLPQSTIILEDNWDFTVHDAAGAQCARARGLVDADGFSTGFAVESRAGEVRVEADLNTLVTCPDASQVRFAPGEIYTCSFDHVPQAEPDSFSNELSLALQGNGVRDMTSGRTGPLLFSCLW